MANKDIDVFIISYNRLSYLKSIVAWLEKAGFENIHIVDNNSTYTPLKEYLKLSKHKVHTMNKNYGHLVVWECGKFKEILKNKNYIVSDCDILPISECPLNITEYFFGILEKYINITKVGFSLKIDDLPNHFIFKENVINWEKKFWEKRNGDGLFDAPIDTTFALYRPGIYPNNKNWWNSIRTDYPYVAKHLPWYLDSSKTNEEDLFYQKGINNSSSYWSLTDENLLNKYNKELKIKLMEVYRSRKWFLLQIIYKLCYFLTLNNKFKAKIGVKKNLLQTFNDVNFLQKNNIEILNELNLIKNSIGWKVLNFSYFF